jgi:copper chaperone CopZ
MTCAHVVHVALTKLHGVESVEVSLRKNTATVKLKPGNTVTVPQLWELIHKSGYTAKATQVSVRGEISNGMTGLQLLVSGTKEALALAADPQNKIAYDEASGKFGQTVTIQGVMTPTKDFKAEVPLRIQQVK